jgi:hypothetical protein
MLLLEVCVVVNGRSMFPVKYNIKNLKKYKMKKFEIRNNGVDNIEWLINKYSVLDVNEANIEALKDDVYETFINNPCIDFSTKGAFSVTIVDVENCAICEFIYN